MNGKSLIGLMYREAVAILSKCNTSMVLIVCEGELTGLFVCLLLLLLLLFIYEVLNSIYPGSWSVVTRHPQSHSLQTQHKQQQQQQQQTNKQTSQFSLTHYQHHAGVTLRQDSHGFSVHQSDQRFPVHFQDSLSRLKFAWLRRRAVILYLE